MKSDFSLPAPAKINHFIHVLERRDDGYHNIQTLFQYLSFGDVLHFSLNTQKKINIQTPNLNFPIQQNLIYKITDFCQKKFNVSSGIEIQLEKNIPIGAGLGGGSSNAATTLLALNYVWELNLNIQELLDIGQKFGADIPFFIFGHAAWGEGIGEQLTMTEIPEKWALVIIPPFHICTADIFQHSELTRGTTAFRIEALERLLKNEQLETEVIRNDFEPLVRKLFPSVADCLDWLDIFSKAKLSGSGSAVFALFDTQEQAKQVEQKIPKDSGYQAIIAKAVNQSPLQSQLCNIVSN